MINNKKEAKIFINDYEKHIDKKKFKFIEHYKNDPAVKSLNLNEEEIIENISIIKKAIDSYHNCNENSPICKNNGLHFELIRNDNNILVLNNIECKKNKHELETKRIKSNYILKECTAIVFNNFFNKEVIKTTDNNLVLLKVLKSLTKDLTKENFIYLEGNTNSGKTYILSAFTNEMAKQNFSVCFLGMIDFTIFAKDVLFDKNSTTSELISNLKNVDILVLDELGNEKFKYFIHIEVIYTVLNYRFINNKTTILSSQFSLNDLKKQYEIDSFKEKTGISLLINRIKSNVKIIKIKEQ